MQEIKLWNLYRSKRRELRNRQKEVLGFSKKSSLLETYNLSSDSILQGAMVTALYGIGGYFVCQGKITLGGVTAFLSYSNYVTGPIALMFNLRFIFAQIKPSMERLRTFLDEATAHIDKEYDKFLHDYILREFSDKTLIMITHRREHLEGMDRVYEIKEGVCKLLFLIS